ncbi:asparagine synthase-related protein [Asticcacaulis sp. ZE23SCel15]|uniref:asparagine synthase-related protein n=1 Tax=Asticcacaulis sp. ZE23SCel15 TaxID=3059027 RepID=UPI0026601C3E|nr:asparagine synthase-related protein [Asticcacaulis sp. ZE23SCel15]WKL58600.1 asparagine synthase-related protein [Asticcacaulis sp. ZE23SCel15]
MSAIAGVFLTSEASARDLVLTMLRAMPYRAPDGTEVWAEGRSALGMGLMRTLPEDPAQATIFEGGTVRAVVDARLDNRPQLLAALGITNESLSEGALILAAWRRWGENCVHHFIGDFALIIYDAQTQRIFAARDHMGVKPLFYRADGAGLALASEPKVLAAPGAPFADLAQAGLIEADVADFMTGQLPRDHRVVYDGLWRVPPGHILMAGPNHVPTLTSYWQAAPDATITDKSPQALRALLTEAVRCRLRSPQPVAALLSGGLNSTSIACLASQLQPDAPVDSFSVVFDKTPHLSERDYIDAGIAHGHFRPRHVAMDGYAPFGDFEALLALEGRLFGAPGLRMTSSLFQRVGAEGFRVVFEGHGGDEVLSHGYGRFHELAQQGRWRELWAQTRAFSGLYGQGRLGLFILLFIRYGRFKGSHSLRRMAAWFQKRWPKADRDVLLTPEFRARAAADHRPQHQDEASQHTAFLQSPGLASSLEVLEAAAAGAGLEARFPFFDKRVVEFCLSLPSEAKLDQGYVRLILRQAMEGVLPPKVQWRRSKFDFAPHIASGLLAHHQDLMREVIDDNRDNVAAFVDLERVKISLNRLRQKGAKVAAYDLQAVWRTVALSLWLRHSQGKTHSN